MSKATDTRRAERLAALEDTPRNSNVVSTILALPSDEALEELVADGDRSDLAVLDLDELYAEARWHREQAEHAYDQARHHWVELGRYLCEIKARVPHGQFMATVPAEVGVSYDRANAAMYVARKLEGAPTLPAATGLDKLVQIVRDQEREKEREERSQRRRLVPIVELPPSLAIERADAADLPIGDELADLIVTSPPYGLGLEIDLTDGYVAYLQAVQAWATEMYRVAGQDGRLCLNVPLDTTRGVPTFIASDWWRILASVGWTFRSCIVWNEGTITHRTGWGSFGSPNAPHVIAPVEVVIVAHKGQWNLERQGEAADLTDDEFIQWTNGLWSIPNYAHPWHPRAFPAELAMRLVKMYSFRGDLVLDPFCGAATAPIEAFRLGRRAYGFDINEEYVARAREDASLTPGEPL